MKQETDTPKFRRAYKLVTQHSDGNWYSFNANATSTSRGKLYCVQYPTDGVTWAYPKLASSKLFVFDTMANALLASRNWNLFYSREEENNFLETFVGKEKNKFSPRGRNFKKKYRLKDNFRIYQCECDGFERIKIISTVSDEDTALTEMWNGVYHGWCKKPAPDGSFGAGRVRLTKHVL